MQTLNYIVLSYNFSLKKYVAFLTLQHTAMERVNGEHSCVLMKT